MATRGYDIDRIRSHVPALDAGIAFFDGPGGTQVPRPVAAAIADALTQGLSNRDRSTASGRVADDVVLAAGAAVADLLGADPRGVVFGRSMTALTYEMSRALAKQWRPGDEVVVTSLDHEREHPAVGAGRRGCRRQRPLGGVRSADRRTADRSGPYPAVEPDPSRRSDRCLQPASTTAVDRDL